MATAELTHKGKVAFQQLPVCVEPGLSQTVIFILPNDVVHDVSKKTSYHEDFHVVTLPTVLKVRRNLWEAN